jgi:hypothetical protein
MAHWRSLVFWIGIAASAWPVAASAQGTEGAAIGAWSDPDRSSLGFNLTRVRYALPCSLGSFLCRENGSSLAVQQHSERWAVELGHVQLARSERSGGAARAEGLNLSLVGRAPLWSAVDVFGKVGTTWGRTEAGPAALAAGNDSGFGVSYGAGLSWALSRRATATLGWESYDFRFAGGRDPVRATSLGLQWRY